MLEIPAGLDLLEYQAGRLQLSTSTTLIKHTLPETNSSPLKIGLPNRKVVFQPSIFRGYVSFREGKLIIVDTTMRMDIKHILKLYLILLDVQTSKFPIFVWGYHFWNQVIQWPFDPPVGGHLTSPLSSSRHLTFFTILKRAQTRRIARNTNNLCLKIYFYGNFTPPESWMILLALKMGYVFFSLWKRWLVFLWTNGGGTDFSHVFFQVLWW